jgi:tRNA(Ile)-lysidine synthase TilS/MesJ
LIRPLIYAQEADVKFFARRQNLPILTSLCPEDHATEREKMKQLLAELEKENEGLRHRIFHAMCKSNIDGFSIHGKYPDAGKLPEE